MAVYIRTYDGDWRLSDNALLKDNDACLIEVHRQAQDVTPEWLEREYQQTLVDLAFVDIELAECDKECCKPTNKGLN